MTFQALYVNTKILYCHLINFTFFLFPKGNYSIYIDLELFLKVFEIFQKGEELSIHVSII
jgi:hypothetical protein